MASYTLFEQSDGTRVSYATWTKDIPTLLPKTDIIAFNNGTDLKNPKIDKIPWARAMALIEDLFLDTKMFPARYFVSKYPTDEQLAEMRSTRG